ncbi:hypothetical protein J4210_05480 [Candidatus Woesearchaeota archaeon]|nr:hypothetical protein [Candidatus Woesearchaeota archaeon]
MNETQEMLLEHMRTFPNKLPSALLEATVESEVQLNLGDFTLRRIPTGDLFYENMLYPGFQGKDVVFLSTPDVRFAYDPATGEEIANTMQRYGVKDRSSLLSQWKELLRYDSSRLRGKGLGGFADRQDEFIKEL